MRLSKKNFSLISASQYEDEIMQAQAQKFDDLIHNIEIDDLLNTKKRGKKYSPYS